MQLEDNYKQKELLRQLRREVMAAKEAWKVNGEHGPIKMSKRAYNSMSRDYRAGKGDETYPSCLVLAKGGTCLVPVEFIK